MTQKHIIIINVGAKGMAQIYVVSDTRFPFPEDDKFVHSFAKDNRILLDQFLSNRDDKFITLEIHELINYTTANDITAAGYSEVTFTFDTINEAGELIAEITSNEKLKQASVRFND